MNFIVIKYYLSEMKNSFAFCYINDSLCYCVLIIYNNIGKQKRRFSAYKMLV